jgi:dihydrofolate reductase
LLGHLDPLRRLFFSRTLSSVEDANTRIVGGNLHDEIVKLKQEQGKDILIGDVDIPSQLVELGLIDEFRFVVGPIVAGEGRRLFEGVSLRERLRLKLVEEQLGGFGLLDARDTNLLFSSCRTIRP